MKKYFIQLTIAAMAVLTLGFGNTASAQCPNDNVLYITGPSVGAGGTYTIGCQYGGEYSTIGVTAGVSYTITTCGGASYDTQITLYNNAGGGALAYNDDFCGLQSSVTWIATFTGTLRILTDQYFCTPGVNFMCTNIIITAAGAAPNPCLAITPALCGVTNSTTLASGPSAFNVTTCGFTTPGAERVYSFTAPTTGTYTLNVGTGSPSDYFDYFYKPTSAGCGPTGWTCIDDISNSFGGSVNFTLTAGTYYILVDKENFSTTATVTHNWSITCPSAICQDFSVSVPFTHSSTTVGAGNDCTLRGSNDRTYKVTIADAGCYTFSMCSTSPVWDSYMYLTTTCCGGTTLASNDDGCSFFGNSIISSITLAAGTYYITIEGFSNFDQGSYTLVGSGGAVPNDDCANATTVSGTFFGSTVCATGTDVSGCTFNDFRDTWYAYTPSQCGTLTVNTCSPDRSYDTQLSLFSACGGTELACNDDFCGLGSSITANVLAGTTYLIRLSGFNGQTGTSTVNVSLAASTLEVTCSGNTTVYPGYAPAECTTISGTATGGQPPYSYAWSNGATTAAQVVCPSTTTTYTLTVTDANGCQATCSVTVCAINVAAGNNQVTICHIPPGNPNNPQTINVGTPAVATHLAHGDYLGPCGVGNQPCASQKAGISAAAAEVMPGTMEAYPNPFQTSTTLVFRFDSDEHVTVKVYNMTGAEVANLFEGDVNGGSTNKVEFVPGAMVDGVYVARLETNSGQVITRRLVIAH
jgi:hypothetical protein